MNATDTQLEQLAERAATLYSRPTVAMELVRLAEDPAADAQLLKTCVAQDPALVGKLLRVVNSSLFGLQRPVGDLNQAIGLLGIKPLKLLVLGFSLPDALFAELAERELEWYWTNTLTRAVAARLISEQLWRQPGDEAFTAGLLQDIGILVLLRELGEPYAKFLSGVIDEKCPLAALEHDTLGFDHLQLSAAMLGRWQLPVRLVSAIAAPKRLSRLERLSPPEGDLPQILHLAELLAQLVGQQREEVLPELLEAGKIYRGMTKSKLAALVEGLQKQVDQLAEVLSLGLAEDRDYVKVLLTAQNKMATLSEAVAAEQISPEDDLIYSELLAHTGELTEAMQAFLNGRKPQPKSKPGGKKTQSHAAHYGQHTVRGFVGKREEESPDPTPLVRKLTAAATRCRERRQELSLLVAEPYVFDIHSDPTAKQAAQQAKLALEDACRGVETSNFSLVELSDLRTAIILLDCDRRAALAIAHQAIDRMNAESELAAQADGGIATTLSVGVATVSAVPKNFDANRVVEKAVRCLSAARNCGTSSVKSIEV